MDYDDNDFQSQNLHLAGEGSNKYPSALQPYALPKFDFDDSLNGHLRFDSLVGTEVFLGIEGNEDSNWIEDFSRGSSGVVFSSSAAESCAISRHNNVWSEATSSESVEMLLKSVGQDEVIVREDTVKKSETFDELGRIMKPMEPSHTHGEKSLPKEETANLLSVDETSRESSALKTDVCVEQPLAGDTSPAAALESLLQGTCANFVPKGASGEVLMEEKLQNEPGDVEQDLVDQNKTDTELTECLNKREPKVSSELRMETDCMDVTVPNIIAGSSELNNEKTLVMKNDINDEGNVSDVLHSSNNKIDDLSTDGKSGLVDACFDSRTGLACKDGDVEEKNVGDIVKPGLKPVDPSDVPVVERGSQDPAMLEAAGEDVSGSCNDSAIECQKFLVSDAHGGSSVETSLDPAGLLTRGQINLAEEKAGLQSHQHTEIASSEHEATPSMELQSEPHLVGMSGTVTPVDSTDELTKTYRPEGISGIGDTDYGNDHASATFKQSTNLASNPCNMDHDAGNSRGTDEMTVTESGYISGSSASELLESKSQAETIPGGISGPIIHRQECQALPLNAEELKHLRKEEAPVSNISLSADLSIQRPSSNANEQLPVFESKRVSSSETGDDQTLPDTVGACKSASQIDQRASKPDKDPLAFKHAIEGFPATDGSKGAGVEDAGGQIIPQKSAETMLEENLGTESQKVSGTEPIPGKDSINAQHDTSFLDNPGTGDGRDGQKSDNTTIASVDNMKVNHILCTEGSMIKIGDSSCTSTFSETPAKSNVAVSKRANVDPWNPSASFPVTSKSHELPQRESEINRVKNLGDQSVLSFAPVGSQEVKGNDGSSGDMSLTSNGTRLADSTVKKVENNSEAANSLQDTLVSPIVVGSPSTSSLEKTAAKTSKGTRERKPRRTSKAAGKETSKKGNATKEATPSTQLLSRGKTGGVNQSSPCTSQIVQSTEKQQNPFTEAARVKPFGTFSTSVSSLPDLNSSSLSTLFQRPFTDLQQVQLRAQIFVYGALIQGTAPDEAYMISAFGGPDGGKGIWEKPWRACVERTQKLRGLTPETPLQSCTGARAPDQITKLALSGKIASPSVGHTSGKDIPAVNPIIPLSSPLWSLPTSRDIQSRSMQKGSAADQQLVFSSLHAHQTPPVKNIAGHNTPWISPSPYRSPWITSPQSNAFDVGTRFPVFPITEAVKLTPVKESSLPHSSAKHLQKDNAVQSGISGNVVKGAPLVDPKISVAVAAQHSTDTKPRKRKKMPFTEVPGSIILNSQKQAESAVSPAVTGCASTSVSVTTTTANLVSNTTTPLNIMSMTRAPVGFAPKFFKEKLNTFSGPILTGGLGQGNHEIEQRSVLSEETVGKLNEAKVRAEDAAALAAAAVSHSQHVWKQVGQQKDAGLDPEIQGRLASAAVAIAAAAAVAKAAAAAANVAANAALQAKLMAEEASTSNTYDRVNEFPSDGSKTLGQATPASILKTDGAVASSSLVLTAAREAARKRVEAAAAAAKRAENMDAIVKAAELAAEAVSQAGKLVTMGDSLPLNELVEADPDNFRRHTQVSHAVEPCNRGTVEKKDCLAAGHGAGLATSASPRDVPTEMDDPVRSLDGASASVSAAGNEPKERRGHKGADLVKSVAVVSEPVAVPKSSIDSQTESEWTIETSKANGFKEGSYAEVFKEGSGLRTAWYSANVLSLKDGKAYVCYSELSSEEGTDKLKEWVSLEGEHDAAPRIRTARSVTAMPFEGTRKRRRAATGDHAWNIGDHVDAWVHGSWSEGVITKKNKKDETTVHFPAQGETLPIKVWHLRPSLFWKDGRWMEYSSSRGINSFPHEGDTPKEKRPRLESPAGEVKGKDNSSKIVGILESGRLPQAGFLDLAASASTFNIGRSTTDGGKPDQLRMKRTGLQKQGSRVIFGVPKPGKKRKFMEVSKHYVSEPGSKTGEQNDPAKLVKPMMPQSSGSRGWKNTSKSDQREKQTALSKPKVFKPVSKTKEKPGAAARTIPQKEDSQNAASSNLDTVAAADQKAENKGSLSGRPTEIQFGSKAGETSNEQATSSSLEISLNAPSSKKTSSLGMKVERTNRGKVATTAGRLAKIEEDKVLSENSSKSMCDTIELRRSNRRIQPTSRLLEGLQTSMIASKIPSASHGKGHQNQTKSSSRGK